MIQSKKTSQEIQLAEYESWIGNSAAIQFTKQKLQSIANSALPILIRGQTGTGKSIAARSLHHHSKGDHHPFISVCCKQGHHENLLKIMNEGWNKAKGGTLFIRNIDLLTESDAAILKNFCLASDGLEDRVRLIASSCDFSPVVSDPMTLESHFMDWLHYHCLTIELPSLMDRVDDMESLVAYYQSKDAQIAKLYFQPSAWHLLKSYPWPGNVKQLKRCLDKLAVQGQSLSIDKDTIQRCFPSMSETPANNQQIPLKEDATIYQSAVLEEKAFVAPPFGEDFVAQLKQDKAMESRAEPPKFDHHPALDKAVVYLYNNFKKPLTMDDLANQACISPSHLSYLFKNYLGLSFKQTLLRLRIVKAMELLVENPNRQVTQVCDDVGFSDLSFFVRKFKATVGMSPGVYRDQYGHTKTSPESLLVEEALAHTMLRLPVRH